MKKAILFILVACFSFPVLAQDRDTTKIKIGNKQYIIVENSSAKNNLEASLLEFEREIQKTEVKIAQKEAKIEVLEAKVGELNVKAENSTLTESERKALEAEEINLRGEVKAMESEIRENQKEIEAFEEGINDIEEQIENMNENEEHDYNLNYENKDYSHKKFDGHWAGFEVGFNSYLNKDFSMELPADGGFMEQDYAKSWSYTINFMEFNIPLYSDKIGLTTGMGIEWNAFHLKQNVNLVEDANGVIIGELQDLAVKDYSKNSLNTFYMNVPLLLEFQLPVTPKGRRVHFQAGVVGGIKLFSKTKQFYEIEGNEFKDKIKGDKQLNPLRYGLTARIGFQKIRLFANYSLVPLFEANKGPELYPFSVGLTVIDF